MQVTSYNMLYSSKQASGAYRGYFVYNLEDGSEQRAGPLQASSEEALEAKALALKPTIGQQTQDAYENFIVDHLGEISDREYCTADQLARRYLSRSNTFSGLERFNALMWMVPAMEYLGDIGAYEAADRLNITEDDWTSIKARFTSFVTSTWASEMIGYVSEEDNYTGGF